MVSFLAPLRALGIEFSVINQFLILIVLFEFMSETSKFKYYTYRGRVYRYPVKKVKEVHPATEERPGRAVMKPAPGWPVRATGTKRSEAKRSIPG